MMRQSVPAFAVVCILASSVLLLGVASPATAADEYQITIDGSVDTPTRQVTVEGRSFDVTAVAKADAGDSIDVDVTDPDQSEEYRVLLYNADQDIMDSERFLTGNQTVTFDTSDFDAESGSYAVVVQADGVDEAVHPLVIKGYDLSVNAPASATPGDNVEVEVDVTVLTPNEVSEANDRVEVVIAGENQDIRQTASGGNGEYSVSMDTDSLDSGSYNVYATMRNDSKTVFGRAELFGISDTQEVELTSGSDNEDNEGEDQTGGGGGSLGGGAGSTTTTSTPNEETQTATPIVLTRTSTPTDTESDNDKTSTPDQPSPDGNSEETEESTATTTPPNVITPTEQPKVTTDTSLPGFNLSLVGALALATTALLRVKSN